MKVALVHDDLIQWGGAERILVGLSEIFPDAPIFTSIVDFQNENIKSHFSDKKIITSFLQKIPFKKSLYKSFLPLYPIAFEQFDLKSFDLVISHTTRFAKSIITKPKTLHICYCHTPPRFLWHFSGVKNFGILDSLMSKLRVYDQISAQRPDQFIAGSQNCKKRIYKIYRRDAKVILPFIELKRFENIDCYDGGYFVAVGRPNQYKRFDLAYDACKKLGYELKIIDGNLTDEIVVRILAGCKGLVIAGEEDFGLASLEAQALGKPVIAYKQGGALETVIDNKTGVFFEEQTVESLTEALEKFNSLKFDAKECRQNAYKFSKEKFKQNFEQAVASLLYT